MTTNELLDTLVEGALTATGPTAIGGNFTVNTDKFVVEASSGDTEIAGDLEVGGTVIFAGTITLGAVGQIAFPATQDPSAGANVLDDYEEGTFTPSIAFGGASVGVTYTNRAGWYVKTGRKVTINLYTNWSDNGSSTGVFTLTGLPFTAEDLTGNFATATPSHTGVSTSEGGVITACLAPDTAYLSNSQVFCQATSILATDEGDVSSTGDWIMFLTYQTA